MKDEITFDDFTKMDKSWHHYCCKSRKSRQAFTLTVDTGIDTRTVVSELQSTIS